MSSIPDTPDEELPSTIRTAEDDDLFESSLLQVKQWSGLRYESPSPQVSIFIYNVNQHVSKN